MKVFASFHSLVFTLPDSSRIMTRSTGREHTAASAHWKLNSAPTTRTAAKYVIGRVVDGMWGGEALRGRRRDAGRRCKQRASERGGVRGERGGQKGAKEALTMRKLLHHSYSWPKTWGKPQFRKEKHADRVAVGTSVSKKGEVSG